MAIEPVFADPTQFGATDIPLAAVLYAVQIYCDFSGYSDVAIGMAALLGYRLTKNFDFPGFRRGDRIQTALLGWPRPVFAFAFGAAAALIPIFLRIGSEPFIYFQF